MTRAALRLLREWTSVPSVIGVCPQSHGGHSLDARYCRICGSRLYTKGDYMAKPDDKGKPDVSWTDDATEDQLRRELDKLGQPTEGDRNALVRRLEAADKPEGWKWEG